MKLPANVTCSQCILQVRMPVFSFSDTFSVDLDCCQQLGRVHGWTSWHWLWATGVYPSGRHNIFQIICTTALCFLFVPQAFLVLLSYISSIKPACLVPACLPSAHMVFIPLCQETFRSCSDISVSKPPRSISQMEGLLKLRVMKRLIKVMKKREKVGKYR